MNRGGKFLRPPPNVGNPHFDSSSDDDSDEDDEVTNEHEQPQSNQVSASANLSSSEGDDDDDDDEEEEINEASSRSNQKRRREEPETDSSNTNTHSNKANHKKAKKPVASSFFDEEAEDEGDEEGDDEPYGTHHDPHDRVKKHYTEDDVRRENMDQDALDIIARQNRRRMQERMLTGETDVAEVARQLEERHRMQSRRVDRAIMDDGSVAEGNVNLSAVSQQSLLPSVSDPKLWMFSCLNGKEQELVIQIMNKCIAHARQGKPLGITSAVAAQSKGKVYIESYSEPAIREAVQGVRGIMAYSMRMVPINDMTTVMTVVPKKKPGEYFCKSQIFSMTHVVTCLHYDITTIFFKGDPYIQ